ncbi:hypothetical protein [Mitsuaria sp. GD03876]|uniref:hypothetical protein n=1 Tax=Mitsuaria sp. GD03876 TaxID=2975399 RepID=UPI00244746F6|nr:hypothetical protein [Mitsuaria sp. GD03876]MDH0865088.1 hypothetical protein [Mitsuaria sp. GD03876]MDH0865094.1 hypothetical protein [Mitsuaria sp. GD03876]
MKDRINFVDEILGFMFEQGFARKFEEVGSPPNDLDVWFRNAQVFRTVTTERMISNEQRIRLLVLIEAIRLDAMYGALPGEPQEFDLTAYEFSEDLLLYKERVIEEVLRQESVRSSKIDPYPSEGTPRH